MGWCKVVMGALMAGGLVAEAGAFFGGSLPQPAAGEPPAAAALTPGPAGPPNLVLPPHLTGAVTPPPGFGPVPQGLPTLQDLVAESPVFLAPPPPPRRAQTHRTPRR